MRHIWFSAWVFPFAIVKLQDILLKFAIHFIHLELLQRFRKKH